jgi:hypothetical protein
MCKDAASGISPCQASKKRSCGFWQELAYQPLAVRLSFFTLREARTSQWAWRELFQVDCLLLSAAGSTPWAFKMLPTQELQIRWPGLASAPWIRSWLQPGFSRTMRSTRSIPSAEAGGRPIFLRRLLQSHFAATNSRCQRRIVSGVTIVPTCSIKFRPRILPLTARQRRWSSLSKMRFCRASLGVRDSRFEGTR